MTKKQYAVAIAINIAFICGYVSMRSKCEEIGVVLGDGGSISLKYHKSHRPWAVHPPTLTSAGGMDHYESNYRNPCWFEGNRTEENLRCIPYFYVIGVQKSGTSTLWNCLIRHPDIAQPETKELGYWDHGPKDRGHVRDHYTQMFKAATKKIYTSTIPRGRFQEFHHKITFDGNPRNIRRGKMLPDILLNLYKGTKIIIIMREPTERLYSDYHHTVLRSNRTFNPETFHSQVVKEIGELRTCETKSDIIKCMEKSRYTQTNVYRSIYYAPIKIWMEHMPRDQFLFLKAEELYSNTAFVMESVFQFLELDPPSQNILDQINVVQMNNNPPGFQFLIPDKNVTWTKDHVSKKRNKWHSYKNTMLPDTKKLLNEFYVPYNQKLAELLGDDRFLF